MTTFRATVLAVLLVLLVPFAPAAAGGPTSAILSVPGEGRTASLYYTDAEYEQLAGLLGVHTTSAGTTDDSGASHESGTGINVTWLIHDVQPWRVDRIYLNADGGPWVATQVMDSETGSIWDSEVVWHQPANGKELAFLLDGLLDGKAVAAPAPAPAPTETPAPAAAEPAEPAEQVSGVWWGLGGLVAGTLLTLGFLRLRQSREDEPELDAGGDWLAPASRTS